MRRNDIPDQLRVVVEEVKTTSIRQAAEHFGVPKSTLKYAKLSHPQPKLERQTALPKSARRPSKSTFWGWRKPATRCPGQMCSTLPRASPTSTVSPSKQVSDAKGERSFRQRVDGNACSSTAKDCRIRTRSDLQPNNRSPKGMRASDGRIHRRPLFTVRRSRRGKRVHGAHYSTQDNTSGRNSANLEKKKEGLIVCPVFGSTFSACDRTSPSKFSAIRSNKVKEQTGHWSTHFCLPACEVPRRLCFSLGRATRLNKSVPYLAVHDK